MPVLVTSIPKCGKNLVISLIQGAGLRRVHHPDIGQAAAHAMGAWTRELCLRRHGDGFRFDLAGIEQHLAATRASFDRLLESISTLGELEFIQGHFAYHPALHAAAEQAGVRIIFLYRDPRAMVSSLAHFLVERGEPSDYVSRLRSHDIESALHLFVNGDDQTLSAADVMGSYRGWLDAEGVIAVRFEDLVGPLGNGSAVTQLEAVRRIMADIGCPSSDADVASVAIEAFNPGSGTFRRGTVGSWRDDLPPHLRREYADEFDRLAQVWGYGADSSVQRDPEGMALVRLLAAESARYESLKRRLEAKMVESSRYLSHLRRLEEQVAKSTVEQHDLTVRN